MQDDHESAVLPDGDRLPITDERHTARRAIITQNPGALTASLIGGEKRDDDDEIDLLAYWHLLAKRRWQILGIIAMVVALALIVTLLTPPTYRATATLEINSQGIEVMQVQGMTPTNTWDPDFAETQVQLLQSRSLAQRVAEDLRLPGSDIFRRLEPPSWMQRIRNLVAPSQKTSEALGATTATQAVAGVTADRQSPTESAAKSTPASSSVPTMASLARSTRLIESGLMIEPIRNTRLVRVHYTSTVPAFSAQVANAIVAGFIAASMDRQVGASSYASKYLQDQLKQLRSRLEDSESELVKYAQQANLVPSTSGASLVSQNLTDLNTQLATAQAKRIAAEARWDTIKNTQGTALPEDMLSGSILPDLQKTLAKLQSEYQEKIKTFKPGFPEMISLKSQIDTAQKQVVAEATNIRASVKAQYAAAVTQENMLDKKLAELRAAALNVDNRSIRYNLLKRDVDTNRELYNAMLQRYKQVSVIGGVKPSNISIIDQAQAPTNRYAPSLSHNLLLGLLLGTFLGVGLAFLLEYLDDTLKTPEDIETRLEIAVLGIVPKLDKESPLRALQDPRSSFSESYRSVRTALQFSTSSGIPKSLLVTSAAPNDGKTTSALTLAHNFAQLGKRVLLIEADLRNPSLGKLMGLSSDVGLSSLLSGVAVLPQATLRTQGNEFDVILSGPIPPSPTELLASSKLVSLLTIAVNTYDQIIIDSPPVLGIADAPILANAAAGTLMVVRSGSTRIRAAQVALQRLRVARARVIGGLLTQYDTLVSGYSYGGYYGYGETRRIARDD